MPEILPESATAEALDEKFRRYCSKNVDYKARWKNFEPKKFDGVTSTIPSELVPFHGTPLFATLTAQEQKSLYLGLIRINAEAFSLLEMLLLLGYRKLVRSPQMSIAQKAALRKLVHEEFLHIKGFHQVLRCDPELAYPAKSVMLKKNSVVRSILGWIASAAPVALALPAVKLEVYSVAYAKNLKKHHGSWDANSWCKVHELHLVDETHHIQLQLEVYQREIESMSCASRLKTVLSIYSCILMLQFLLVGAAWRVTREAFPKCSGVQSLRMTLKLVRWIVRDFEPYRETQKQLRLQFDRFRPKYQRLFSFMHW